MANEASNADAVDKVKRRFLVGATSVVGGIGVIATATPFMMSMWPSERAKAAGVPVEVDVSKIEPGQKIDVEWRGKVVWLLNRTQPMLDSLPKLDPRVADPQSKVPQQPPYCQNEHRSIKPMLFIAVGICTHPRTARRSRRRTSVPTGSAAFSAHATSRSSTWPAACTRASLRRSTSSCRRTSMRATRRS